MIVINSCGTKMVSTLNFEIVKNQFMPNSYNIYHNDVGIMEEYLSEKAAIEVLNMISEAYRDCCTTNLPEYMIFILPDKYNYSLNSIK